MPRKKYRIRITGDQREHIDPHQITQILLDLMGPAQVEALTAEVERSDGPEPDPKVWREEDGGRW
ncbi:hypothetical protein SAMN05216298_4687 [Glycomyces sambucus]|uniref:Uncharacterized protein n=1 Tax=Glycomyces sambucus TaxID=380244 RepID=A0A1G9LWN8_9ACTN|nr:hypothetical protein [Glycomyces sambucus]SDL66214.1 hypothetical protein SAMN05216298_4687 [Glycomyces sambucus]